MQEFNKLNVSCYEKGEKEVQEKMTKCPVCGSEIAKSAKTCPQCGAKNKQPANKTTKIILIAIVMIIAVIILIKFLGIGDTKATIIDNQGNTVELTAKDLIDIYDENEATFDTLYHNAEVSLVGTVDKIEYDISTAGGAGLFITEDYITLKGGWKFSVVHGSHDDILLNLKKGDKIEIKTEISDVWGSEVEINDYSSHDARNWKDNSSVKLQE